MNFPVMSLRALAARLAGAALLASCVTGAVGQVGPQAHAPGFSHIEGSVVFASAGSTEWVDASPNRPIMRGDRLWTDKGARAEVQLGSAALHMDSETFVEVLGWDRNALLAALNEGALSARVRQRQGENFKVSTPQLTFRPLQAGEYRLDVDPARNITRVTVRSGTALVNGIAAGAIQMHAGQQIAFSGRDLKVAGQGAPRIDSFDRWAVERNRAEDQAVAARNAPRTIAQQQPGPPGHWEWIAPWGWAWVQPQGQEAAAPPQAMVRPQAEIQRWRPPVNSYEFEEERSGRSRGRGYGFN